MQMQWVEAPAIINDIHVYIIWTANQANAQVTSLGMLKLIV